MERVLLGPGPSLTPPSVQAAMVRPQVGHMDPALAPVLATEGIRLEGGAGVTAASRVLAASSAA